MNGRTVHHPSVNLIAFVRLCVEGNLRAAGNLFAALYGRCQRAVCRLGVRYAVRACAELRRHVIGRYIRLSEIAVCDRPDKRVAAAGNAFAVYRPAGHILTCRRYCRKGERLTAARGRFAAVYGDVIAGSDVVLDLLELRCNVNRVCTGRVRIGVGRIRACVIIAHVVDIPAFDFVTRLYLCRELDRHTCRNIHTDSRITEDRRFIRLCRADIAAFARFVCRTEGDAGHQLDKANLNRRFTLQSSQLLAHCGIRCGLAVDGPVLYAVACVRHRRDRDIRVAVEAVRACFEVLLLVCAHALASDFCGNRTAVSLVTERINGQGEVVLRERLKRCMNVYIAFDRATPGISGVIIFCSVDIRPTGNVPVVSLVAIIRCCRKYDIAAVLLDMIAGVQHLAVLLCCYMDVSVTAKGYRRLLCKEYLNQGIIRNLDIILRYLARLISLRIVVIECLRCTISRNHDFLHEITVVWCCRDCCRAVHIHMTVFTLSTSQYNILDTACASNFDCAVDRRSHRHLRLLQHRYFNCRIGVPAGQNRLVGVLCVLRCVLPAGNVVVLTYRSCEGHFGVRRNRIAAADRRAADFRGDRRDIRVRDILAVCVHCLEGDLCRLCCTDHDLDRVILRDIAQRKAGFCTRTDCRLAVYLPLLDRVVIVQIFQRKGHCRAVRNGIKVCLRSVRQLRRGLLLTDRRTGFVHVGEGHLMGLGVAERYADRVILFDVLQRQRFLTVQIGRTRPAIRLVVHHPACYRHTGVRRSRERHICAFRNLLSGRDCTAVL